VCWCGQRWDGNKMLPVDSNINETKEAEKK